MNREELIQRECTDLDILSKQFMREVQDTLSKIRNEPCTLFLKKADRYRLLKLRTWANHYKVSLVYVLSVLVPFWEKFVQRRSQRMKKAGLNVRVSTLTGKKSQNILQEQISKDFPTGENQIIWKSNERDRIFARAKQIKERKEDDGIKVRVRTTPILGRRYVKKYMHNLRKETSFRDKIIEQFQSHPYRNNPFLD